MSNNIDITLVVICLGGYMPCDYNGVFILHICRYTPSDYVRATAHVATSGLYRNDATECFLKVETNKQRGNLEHQLHTCISHGISSLKNSYSLVICLNVRELLKVVVVTCGKQHLL